MLEQIITTPVKQSKYFDVNFKINLRGQVSQFKWIELNQYPYLTTYKLHNTILNHKHLKK